MIRVLFSPRLGNSKHIVAGMSAVPAGLATPVHSHEAEELAFILEGSGTILIGEERIPVSEGDLVLTASGLLHQTIADEAGALVVLWIYAPPGSEDRWFSDVVIEEEES
jgi:gentisate 1,2-dioxygenase